SGVWKMTRWASAGSTAVRIAAPSTAATAAVATMRTSRQPATRVGRSATVGLPRDADGRDEHLARERGAAPGEQARLRSMERDREICTDDGRGRVARGQVHRGRRVDGDDR